MNEAGEVSFGSSCVFLDIDIYTPGNETHTHRHTCIHTDTHTRERTELAQTLELVGAGNSRDNIKHFYIRRHH